MIGGCTVSGWLTNPARLFKLADEPSTAAFPIEIRPAREERIDVT
jgi:hypothetical protein